MTVAARTALSPPRDSQARPILASASTWQPVDLEEALSPGATPPEPTLGRRSDGFALLYPGRVHSVAGESEAGKSWLLLLWCRDLLAVGEPVVYVDFEDDAAAVVQRLLTLGAQPEQIRRWFVYIRPEEPLGEWREEFLATAAASTLVIFDGVTELMSLQRLRPTDDVDVAEMLLLPREVAAAGSAVVLLDHVPKDKGRSRYATGSQHKLSGITGAAYILEQRTPFAEGQAGGSRLLIVKDRPGAIRGSSLKVGRDAYAIAELTHEPEGPTSGFALTPPDASNSGAAFQPTVIMQRVSDLLEQAGEDLPKTFNDIKRAVRGKSDYVRMAVDELVRLGHVAVADGPNNSKLHRLMSPYKAPSEQPKRALSR